MRKLYKCSVVFTILFFGLPVWAQQPTQQQPCSTPEAAQFDFWVGDWDLSWQGPQGGTPAGQTGKARNRVYRDMSGCVIYENFSTVDSSFLGSSWSVYQPQQAQWRQTWVDNSGSYLLFKGGYADGRMVLKSDPVENNGKVFVSRMVFKNISKNSLDWDWQRSDDGGATWKDLWNIHYVRRDKSSR